MAEENGETKPALNADGPQRLFIQQLDPNNAREPQIIRENALWNLMDLKNATPQEKESMREHLQKFVQDGIIKTIQEF